MKLSPSPNRHPTENLRLLHPGGQGQRDPRELEAELCEARMQQAELVFQNRILRESAADFEAAVRRYCDLYDHLPIGYVTLNESGQIVQANLTAAGWLRRDRAKLVGGYFSWFLDAFDAGRFAGHLETCFRTRTEHAMEVTLRVGDGLLLTVQLTSRPAPVEEDGKTLVNTAITSLSNLSQIQAVNSDIEHERQTYQQSVGKPGGSPMPTVSRFARELLREHATELSPQVKQSLERMKCAAARLEATFQDLLDYCTLGHDEEVLDPVNLDELVQQVVMEQRASIERRQADIAVDRPLPCVRGARLLLGQVLANVVSHMLRCNFPGRPCLRIAAGQQGADVVMTIHDERMPPDAAPDERSFRAFERGHERESFWLTGVGIAVVRRTIERMNGRLEVDAGIGKRTTVSIALPAV